MHQNNLNRIWSWLSYCTVNTCISLSTSVQRNALLENNRHSCSRRSDWLRTGLSCVYIHNHADPLWPHTASSLIVTVFLFHGQSAPCIKLTNLHLVLRLIMSGAIPLLHVYACAVWVDTTCPFTCFLFFR